MDSVMIGDIALGCVFFLLGAVIIIGIIAVAIEIGKRNKHEK